MMRHDIERFTKVNHYDIYYVVLVKCIAPVVKSRIGAYEGL